MNDPYYILPLSRNRYAINSNTTQKCYNASMNKRPLYVYMIGVVIVWAAILTASWFGIIWTPFGSVVTVCVGFFLGMLAMYIAVHLYRWK